MNMARHSYSNTYALDTTVGATAKIDISEFASGEIFIPTGSAITSLTWWAADDMDAGTYLPAQDAAAAAVTQTVAATKAYPIPAILFGARALKCVVNAAGSVIINLKG